MSQRNASGKTAFLFPGQGAVPKTAAIDFIGTSVETSYNRICSAKAFELGAFQQQNVHTDDVAQLGVFALSLAMGWEAVNYCQADMITGYSSGLYAAMVASGCLSPQQGNHAICLAYEGVCQGDMAQVMVGVVGLGVQPVQDILCRLRQPGALSLVNNKSQVIVSISKDELSTFQTKCLEAGALRVIPLPFKYPYHVAGLKNSGKRLHDYFRSLHLPLLMIPVVVGSKPEFIKQDSARAADLVASQLYQTVWWNETIYTLMHHGAEKLVVFDSTETLTRIVRWISRQITVINIASPDDLNRLQDLR